MAISDPNDPRLFQIPAQDNKGHSVKKTFRIPPQLEAQIEILIASKKFPYRTDGEFIRHAIVQKLQELEKKEPLPNSMMGQIMSIVTTVQMEEERREFTEVVDKVVREVNMLVGSENTVKAQELMDKVLLEVEKIQDPYWRNKYRTEIVNRLNNVKRTIRVGLKPSGYSVGDN